MKRNPSKYITCRISGKRVMVHYSTPKEKWKERVRLCKVFGLDPLKPIN